MLTLFSQAWRSWRTAPGPAAFAIAALAVGIGCATAIFTVVDAIMLKPLPYSQGERWVALFAGSTDASVSDRYSSLPVSDLVAYQTRLRSLDAFGWFTLGGDYNLTSPGAPQHIEGIEATPSLIATLGVSPIRGRLLNASDGANAALISQRLWTRLGSDPNIIGRTITLDDRSYTVTGVMPAPFRLPVVSVSNVDQNNDVWLPVKPPRNEGERHGRSIYAAYGRLKPGVTVEQARAEAKRVAAGIAREDPTAHHAYTAVVFSLRETVVREIRPVLMLLLAAAGLLLLITCANVAGLLVARGAARAHETAIRLALGAGRKELGVQFLFEGLLVSLIAAFLGIAASAAMVRVVVSLAADFIPRAGEISVNWPVLFFALAAACFTATLCSIAPLWQALRTQPQEALSDGVRTTAGLKSRRFSQSLVVVEIALAFTLLAAGALLIAQLENLRHTWPGFDSNHLLTFQMNASEQQRKGGQALVAYQKETLQALERIPGVSSAAIANQLPLEGCCFGSAFFAEGQAANPNSESWVSLITASTGYFETMRIPLRRGRLLNEHDTNETLPAVVIDEAAAQRYWSGRDPVGAIAHFESPNGSRVQVVGVVGNVRNAGLGQVTRPEVYVPSTLAPPNPVYVVVRSNWSAEALTPAVRRAVQSVDPAQPIFAVSTMQQIAGGSLALERINSTVMMVFAGAALLMAALGVYGLTAFSVRQRTVEMGMRRALGATGPDLLWLIVGSGLRMGVGGIVLGALAAAAATRLILQFFHLQSVGPLPFAYSTVAVLALAMLASFFPAWRATLITPMVAIRNEGDSVWAIARRGVEQVFSASPEDETALLFDSTLLTELTAESRRARTFDEALRAGLARVCEKIDAGSAALLESDAEGNYRCMVRIPEDGLTRNLPGTGFLLNRLRSYTSPLTFSAGDWESSLRWARERKPEHRAEIEALQQYGVRMAVPLRSRKEIIGVLLFGAPGEKKQYSSADKKLLRACADQFALMIENARLTDRVLEQEKIRSDVALAAEVQRRLLPDRSPETAAASLAAFSLPARSVGGDYYDYFRIGDQRLGIAIADVAGKGIAAALLMAFLRASLRIFANEANISPRALAAKMNQYLHGSTSFSSYATFFYAEFDEQTRELRYVNAGHTPPYLVRSQQIEELATGGTVIGLFPVAAYEEGFLALLPGDVLLACTDGVTEAMNAGEEEFGEERLQDLLRSAGPLPVDEMMDRIFGELKSWIGDAPQHDDLTFIVMKVS